MVDVYAFEESESIEKCEELKQRLGFTPWNIDVKGNQMCVLIDRIDIYDKFKDMAPEFKFGEFIKAGQIVDDHNCLQLPFAAVSPQTGSSNCSNVVISNDSDTQVDTGVKLKRTRNETFDIGDTLEALWVNKRPFFKKWYWAEITSDVKKGETYQVKFEEYGFKQVLDVTRIRK